MLVGVLQSAGLVLVDAHSRPSRLVSVTDDDNTTVTAAVTSPRLIDSDARVIELADVPFWLFSLHRYLSAVSLLSTALYTVNLSFHVVSFSLKFSLTSELLSSEFCRLLFCLYLFVFVKHGVECVRELLKCRLYRMSSALSVDYVTILVLAILLAVKYVHFDPDEDDATATVATVTASTTSAAANSRVVKSCFGDGQSVETQTEPTNKLTKFYVGDSSSDDNDSDVESATTSTIETQTELEEVENQPTTERPRPPRPLDECVAILNSVV